MMCLKEKECDSFWANVFIAGDYHRAVEICERVCLKGLCVTVSRTKYVYSMGVESGVIVGLINYPRFPKEQEDLFSQAIEIGKALMEGLNQGSFSIVTPTSTKFFSRREWD